MTDRQDSDAPPSKGPVRLYLETLSDGPTSTQRAALRNMAAVLWPGSSVDFLDQPWWTVSYEQAISLRSHLVKTYAPGTGRRYMNAFRGVMKESWRLGRLSHENLTILSSIRRIQGSGPQAGRALSRAQAELLIAADIPLRDKAMIVTMLAGALRVHEVSKLEARRVTVNPDTSVTIDFVGKGNKRRYVTIAGRSGAIIAEWRKRQRSGRLFGLCKAHIWYIVKHHCEKLGMGKVSPHDLRRTGLTLALDQADVLTVQRLAGHSSPRTTAIYDRRGEAAALKLANSLGL